jgi:hypothetical protein
MNENEMSKASNNVSSRAAAKANGVKYRRGGAEEG